MPMTPNRALIRHKLEALAWEQTPAGRRGGSGSKREVLLDTTDGTGMVPLSALTDYQLRRYIGPGALEEAGDMRKNAYRKNGSPEIEEFDAPAHWASALINGDTSGLSEEDLKELEEWQEDNLELGWVVGASEEPHIGRWNGLQTELLTYTAHLQPHEASLARKGRDHAPNASPEKPEGFAGYYVDRGDPVFVIGDLASRKNGNCEGEVVDISTRRGTIEYLVALPNGDRIWFNESELEVPGHQKNASSRAPADEAAARELSLYIDNEYSLVGAPNSQGKAIEKNLLRKLKAGTFDLKLSEQAYMYLVETGAKKYAKEFASAQDWNKIFSKATRELVAYELASTFYEEYKLGNKGGDEHVPNAKISRITKACVVKYEDNGETKVEIEGVDTKGKTFHTSGPAGNSHMEALLERAKREGVRVKHEKRGWLP
jgi:hypothetical protein